MGPIKETTKCFSALIAFELTLAGKSSGTGIIRLNQDNVKGSPSSYGTVLAPIVIFESPTNVFGHTNIVLS